MPTLNEALRRRLVAKYGTNVNLEARSDVVADLLRNIADQLHVSAVQTSEYSKSKPSSYSRTYQQGYNKENYSRSEYSKYCKTSAGGSSAESFARLVAEIRPELDKLIIEKLRAEKKRE